MRALAVCAAVALSCCALATASEAGYKAAATRPRAADKELRESFVSLVGEWKFRPDPEDRGEREDWERADINGQEWQAIKARDVWEKQGFPGYDGVGWYAKDVVIPQSWKGSIVEFISNGVDDEFDLWVNGRLIGHRGDGSNRELGSVARWRTVTPIREAVKFGKTNRLVLRVNDWRGDGGLWGDLMLRRALPMSPYRKYLPEPVIASKPEWVRLYWKAWEEAWTHIAPGTPENHFAPLYMDEAFNEDVYQWDSVFMTLFGRYGDRLFPSIDTLDNFYQGQRADGYIQRIYLEDNGKVVYEPSADDPNVNPPLFAWAELEYYRTTGDKARLTRVYPVLTRYFDWLNSNTRTPMGNGLYFQTDFGSGMDNVPRAELKKGTWTDMSLQMALFARQLEHIAGLLEKSDDRVRWKREFERLKDTINRVAWSAEDGFYYDVQPNGQPTRVRHIGAFWALLSEVADDAQVRALVKHLEDPKEFNRPHLFPSLAASDPHYDPRGNYWVGGIWASTNYMLVKGLEQRGYRDFARKAAENHIENMAQVLVAKVNEAEVNPPERDGDYQSIWECYAPESATPGTTWDAKHLSRHHFVGWSGAGPIAMLIENVLGFDISVPENKVTWYLNRTDEHGVRNMALGDNDRFDAVAEARRDGDGQLAIRTRSTKAFKLVVRAAGAEPTEVQVRKGEHRIKVELRASPR